MTNCRVGYSRRGNGSFRIRQESDDPIGHSKQASSNGQFAESSNLIANKLLVTKIQYECAIHAMTMKSKAMTGMTFIVYKL